ncbi:MAG TPA: glycoside hydrolase family 6 protein [Gaiellaceae bacterium]
MRRRSIGFVLLASVVAGLAVAASAASGARAPTRSLTPDTRFLVPPPNQAGVQQAVGLLRAGQVRNALLVGALLAKPHAVWVTKGSPTDARNAVRSAAALADIERAVPVLVAYDIPGRDCGGFSAGGAQTTSDYKAWIDGFATGLGNHKAVVILEPDGLGLLPSNCGGPNASYPFTDAERYEELNYAVDRLEQQPGAIVYLDGTHSAWLNTHDIATRLVQAGVQRAQGFFLNVSNYQFTSNGVQYGTWVSKCITLVTTVDPNFDCPNQYWNGGPNNNFVGVALSPYGQWSDGASEADLDSAGENLRLAGVAAATHFVIDTSRNGAGPWRFPAGAYPDPQDWCNPPGRGLGLPATANTGNPLVDAYLWVKVPGESDGSCNRGVPGSTTDPEWAGIVDPAAGQWFPQQALQLAQLANPALLR